MSPERVDIEVDGRRLSLSNLDKVLYPKTGFTKGAVLDYYARIAPVMVPHLADRPITFRRYPDGVDGMSFYEKHVPSHAPEWVRTVRVPHAASGRPRGKAGGGEADIEYAIVSDRPTLVWAANLAALEFHVPLWHIAEGNVPFGVPDYLVFDLDPGPGTSIVECCRVAGWLRHLFETEALGEVFAKTSGSKGLQLYVAIQTGTDSDTARAQALNLAQRIEKAHPRAVVTNMRKELRRDRVLIDWSQNHPAKTTVAVYSLRAREEPTTSTPVTWEEVEHCERKGDPTALRFFPKDVLERVERQGDLMASLTQIETPMPKGSSTKGGLGGLAGLTREQLLARAAELDLRGRTKMTKLELVSALRDTTRRSQAPAGTKPDES